MDVDEDEEDGDEQGHPARDDLGVHQKAEKNGGGGGGDDGGDNDDHGPFNKLTSLKATPL